MSTTVMTHQPVRYTVRKKKNMYKKITTLAGIQQTATIVREKKGIDLTLSTVTNKRFTSSKVEEKWIKKIIPSTARKLYR